MGLGKTAQTICFIDCIISLNKYPEDCDEVILVVCPATLVENWIREFERWAPHIPVCRYHGAEKYRTEMAMEILDAYDTSDEPPYRVLVTTAGILSNSKDRQMLLKKLDFSLLVVDEGHAGLKNTDTKISKVLQRQFSSLRRRLIITGTPVQNDDTQLLNLMSITDPENLSLDSLNDAVDDFREKISSHSPDLKNKKVSSGSRVRCLQNLLAPFILRRIKSEVLSDLPVKQCFIERCPMEGRQKEMYMHAVGAFKSCNDEKPEKSEKTIKKKENRKKEKNAFQKELNDLANDARQISETTSSAASQSSVSETLDSIPTGFLTSSFHRMRRICNHQLLSRGYFSAKDVNALMGVLRKVDDMFVGVEEWKVKEHIESLSDYELNHLFSQYNYRPEIKDICVPASEFLASAKIKRLLALLHEVKAEGKKALVFSQYTMYLDVVETVLSHVYPADPDGEVFKYLRFDGTVSLDERAKLVDEFQSPGCDVVCFLLSTKAAGVGLNLTAATIVVLLDQDFNPHTDKQAEDRCHRLGQQFPVKVYRYVCEDSIEEDILKVCADKLKLDNAFGGQSDVDYVMKLMRDNSTKSLVTGKEFEEGIKS
eukprot:GHVL01040835.1.p1 GENE.GHVL01040835.1~~GHVL01040835.1.p1  ORF type:complete len:597 (+),score=114.31 GHVL01040835.1:750-2540(+)